MSITKTDRDLFTMSRASNVHIQHKQSVAPKSGFPLDLIPYFFPEGMRQTNSRNGKRDWLNRKEEKEGKKKNNGETLILVLEPNRAPDGKYAVTQSPISLMTSPSRNPAFGGFGFEDHAFRKKKSF